MMLICEWQLIFFCILFKLSTNGFISFGGDFNTDSFDVRNLSSNTIPYPMIAPLWADFDFREEGNIFYRATSDTEILRDIADRISFYNSKYTDYVPKEAIIITWFQSRLFNGKLMVSY